MADARELDQECIFAVVGEHRTDPSLLLLRGEDGRFYRLDPADGVPAPVDLAAHWRLDPTHTPAATPPAPNR